MKSNLQAYLINEYQEEEVSKSGPRGKTLTHDEAFEIIDKMFDSEIKARSFRLNSSFISNEHEFIRKGKMLGLKTYGSPTLSDQALIRSEPHQG